MLQDILVDSISTEPDMHLMRERSETAAPHAEGGATPDVVIVGAAGPGEAQNAGAMLSRWPLSRVLMVSISGARAALYELQPHRTELGEMSPRELVHAIRAACRDDGDPHGWRVPAGGTGSGKT